MPYQTNYFSFFNNNFQYLNIKNYYLKILTKQRKRVFFILLLQLHPMFGWERLQSLSDFFSPALYTSISISINRQTRSYATKAMSHADQFFFVFLFFFNSLNACGWVVCLWNGSFSNMKLLHYYIYYGVRHHCTPRIFKNLTPTNYIYPQQSNWLKKV